MQQVLDALREWTGRTETQVDCVTAASVQRLAATLDRDDPPPRPGDPLPPGWYSMLFPRVVRQSEFGADLEIFRRLGRIDDHEPPLADPAQNVHDAEETVIEDNGDVGKFRLRKGPNRVVGDARGSRQRRAAPFGAERGRRRHALESFQIGGFGQDLRRNDHSLPSPAVPDHFVHFTVSPLFAFYKSSVGILLISA
jgi:hypothetical protein